MKPKRYLSKKRGAQLMDIKVKLVEVAAFVIWILIAIITILTQMAAG